MRCAVHNKAVTTCTKIDNLISANKNYSELPLRHFKSIAMQVMERIKHVQTSNRENVFVSFSTLFQSTRVPPRRGFLQHYIRCNYKWPGAAEG